MAESQVTVENGFIRGLISEATGLNFPKDGCTDTLNCVFDQKGVVSRRLGFDYESSNSTTSVTRSSSAITEYLWESVGGNGNLNFVVVQVGDTLHFYEITSSGALSGQRKSGTVSLSSFTVAGGTASNKHCSFSSGYGYLFVANAACEPFYVSWNGSSFTTGVINVWVRDLIGIEEDIPFNLRPSSLTAQHKYNLWNQGWYAGYQTMYTGDSSGAIKGAVPFENWEAWRNNSEIGGYPSNADVWWSFRDADNYFSIPSVRKRGRVPDNTPAPKGHYILRAFNQRKGESKVSSIVQGSGSSSATVTLSESVPFVSGSTVTIEGASVARFNGTFTISSVGSSTANTTFVIPISGTTAAATANEDDDFYCCLGNATEAWISAGTVRPSAIAFFAGRVFYAGTNTAKFNDKIYFSKIIEQDSDFGRCHQVNDPTAEELSDLLPSDGGVISIPEIGNIVKMIPVGNDLILFATNGVWSISGSEGIGFRANDYSVRKISNVPAVSPLSFVVADGAPIFWNTDGIYTLSNEGVIAISDKSIKSWFNVLPTNAKSNAKGTYDPLAKTVYWLYRSTSSTTVDGAFAYDRVLCLNLLTGAFYPWSIGTGGTSYPNVNGVIVTPYVGSAASKVKYYTTKLTSGSTYTATFSEVRDTAYVDWETPSVGLDYSSFFATGFRVPGEGMRQQFGNYINVFCNVAADSSLKLRAKWDYANNSASGEWSSEQEVYVTRAYRDTLRRRVKLRGRGIACQLNFRSTAGKPFSVIGWSMLETVNPGP